MFEMSQIIVTSFTPWFALVVLMTVVASTNAKVSCPFKLRNVPLTGRIFETLNQDSVISTKIGTRDVIFLNNYNVLADGFDRKTPDFNGKPTEFVVADVHNGFGLETGDFTTEWFELNYFVVQFIDKFLIQNPTFEEAVEKEMLLVIEKIKQHNGEPFSLRDLLFRALIRHALFIALGTNYETLGTDAVVSLLKDKIDELTDNKTVNVAKADAFPEVRDDPEVKQFLKSQQEFVQLVSDFAAIHFNQSDFETGDGFLNEFRRRMPTDGQPSSFSVGQLLAIGDTLFRVIVPALDRALRWSFLAMVKYPTLQEKAAEEIRKVLGDSRPSSADTTFLCLPKTQAMLYETLRMYHPFPMSLTRRTLSDTTVQDGPVTYKVPGNVTVYPNFWRILNDEDTWKNPTEFDPGRFLTQKCHYMYFFYMHCQEELVQPPEWIVFSTGTRKCAGEKLAKSLIMMYLSHLLREFKFSADDDTDFDQLNGDFSILLGTWAPKSYQVRATSRAPVKGRGNNCSKKASRMCTNG